LSNSNPSDGSTLLHALAKATIQNSKAFELHDENFKDNEEDSDESMNDEGNGSQSEESSSSSEESEQSDSDASDGGSRPARKATTRNIGMMPRRRPAGRVYKAAKAQRSQGSDEEEQVTKFKEVYSKIRQEIGLKLNVTDSKGRNTLVEAVLNKNWTFLDLAFEELKVSDADKAL
jgi:cobalamin biosynthesis protein CobT